MDYPPEDGYDNPNNNYYNENAGYPQFSEVHQYPEVNKLVPKRNNQNKQKNIKPQKPKSQKKQTKPKKKKKIQPLLVPANQLYMDHEGQQYLAVPVGPPQLVPLAPKNPTPVTYANAPYQAYPNAYPNYGAPCYQQPPAYPYYPPPPPPPPHGYGMGYPYY